MAYVPWEGAWREALYGANGFFRCQNATEHFRTSAASEVLAQALAGLARDVHSALGFPPQFTVVDVGAGDGQLLAQIGSHVPAEWRLHAVDVRARPADLAERITWTTTAPRHMTGLLIAHELLDAIPCPIVELGDDEVVRLTEVNPSTGQERAGSSATPTDLAWLDRWWPLHEPGQRAEVGHARDAAWRDLVATIDRGLAVAIDYGHGKVERQTLAHGTLCGYRDGLPVPPMPDGSCDITAHVALDACAANTYNDKGSWTRLTTQADVLAARGVTTSLPSVTDASTDQRTYAQRLAAANQGQLLLDPAGVGSFGWLLHGTGLDPEAVGLA